MTDSLQQHWDMLRHALLWEGWLDIRRVFFAALIIDVCIVICELIEFRWIYPGQALIIAAVLAVPSYALIRSLTNRLARRWHDANRPTAAV
jgi:hypothetical protein